MCASNDRFFVHIQYITFWRLVRFTDRGGERDMLKSNGIVLRGNEQKIKYNKNSGSTQSHRVHPAAAVGQYTAWLFALKGV